MAARCAAHASEAAPREQDGGAGRGRFGN
jgi:hypothetical protein